MKKKSDSRAFRGPIGGKIRIFYAPPIFSAAKLENKITRVNTVLLYYIRRATCFDSPESSSGPQVSHLLYRSDPFSKISRYVKFHQNPSIQTERLEWRCISKFSLTPLKFSGPPIYRKPGQRENKFRNGVISYIK
jgi:hypothetical protein